MEQFKFHVGMNVSDIEKSVPFYQKLFGADPIKVEKDYAKFELDNPGLVISFIQSDKASPQFGHLGIRVNSQQELDKRKQEVESQLEIALEEKNTSCCYAVQNKFWVKDPDGYDWEVYHFLKDDNKLKNDPSKDQKELVGCC